MDGGGAAANGRRDKEIVGERGNGGKGDKVDDGASKEGSERGNDHLNGDIVGDGDKEINSEL